MVLFLEISFGLAVAALVYSYGGFSLLLLLIAKLLNRQVKKGDFTPRVTVIIAAYNEQHSIAAKLDNVLGLDYPSQHLEVIVASDGSDDATKRIASAYVHKGVKFLDLPRRGKVFALNDAVIEAQGEILVFSDANTLFLPQALRMLVRNFADPQVGGVCGNQEHIALEDGDNSSKGEHLYWAYDKWLKTMESLTGSIVSADGAIYAIRRTLYRTPSQTDVTDDFAISTAVIEQGYRLVFESDALAHEKASTKAENEFIRKVRIMNRGLRGVMMRKKLLNPLKYGVYSLILFSHKVLRRLVPFMLIWLLATSLLLAVSSPFFRWVSAAQLLFYLLAFLGYVLRNTQVGHSKILYVPFFFCLANAAAFVAILKLLRGKRIEFWQPHRESLDEKKLVKTEVL